MLIRGALHVHSDLSHDGQLPIRELAGWYGAYGYQFIALGEHAQDMDQAKVRALEERCQENSSPSFCLIPGLEFACKGGFHILGLGVTSLISSFDPAAVVDAIHQQNGYAVLAHPKRNSWKCPLHVTRAIDAAEIWNVVYDGKFLPSPQSLAGFPNLRRMNPKLLAVAGHDFHQKGGFYDVAIEMNAGSLSSDTVLRNLRNGAYWIRAPLFSCGARAEFSRFQSARLRITSWHLGKLRRLREVVSG